MEVSKLFSTDPDPIFIQDVIATNSELIEHQDQNGRTPLIYMCFVQNWKIAELLLELGANCQAIDHVIATTIIEFAKIVC